MNLARGDSVRLRLARSEVNSFARGGRIETRVAFPEKELVYTLDHAPSATRGDLHAGQRLVLSSSTRYCKLADVLTKLLGAVLVLPLPVLLLACGTSSSSEPAAADAGTKVQWCHMSTLQPATQADGNVATETCTEYFFSTPTSCSATEGQCPVSDAGPLVGCCKVTDGEGPGNFAASCYFSDFASPAFEEGCTNPNAPAIPGTWQTTLP